MAATKAKQNRGSKLVRVLILNVTFVLFGLCAVASGTYAWFNSNRSFETTSGAFEISAGPTIEYELFYLDHFVDGNSQTKPGNQNPTTHYYSGYETEYDTAVFSPTENNPDSLNIQQLWPAHKLTFAILMEGSEFGDLKVDTWSEQLPVDDIPMAIVPSEGEGEDTNIRISLAWAINVYGKAYNLVKSTGDDNKVNDIARAYTSYKGVAVASNYGSLPADQKETKAPDVFNYTPNVEIEGTISDDEMTVKPSNALIATSSDAVEIVDEGVCDRTIIFFTIEFSNDSQTFYEFSSSSFIVDPEDEQDPGHNEFYYCLDVDGNSNCYENLALASLKFALE